MQEFLRKAEFLLLGGKDGHWRKHDPMKLASIDAFFDDPKLVWEWYEDRRKNILAAKPNDGHFAISKMEKFKDVVILTQNIDGLHQRSGSTNVLELHGSIIRIKCTVCNFSDNITENFESLPPKCECGNMLRPDVVWFGEALPQDVWKNAMEEASTCDMMIIAGTSLAVSPANTLPIYAKQNGATLIEVNPEKTVMSNDMDLSIQTTSANALPKILAILKNQ
uniref:Silent information regulator protein Sir2 (NpdA) n=1 Tax=uncultured marine thaumarchaeote AD1000_80_F03 TaxID=1455943 RepID=A0A075FXM9_9ARCH|nr:silent information regulator protein Sir2 (npdA) [uncultured marine thaumarchaeote AD1000_80_F03]